MTGWSCSDGDLQRLLGTGQAGTAAGKRNTVLGWDPTEDGFKKCAVGEGQQTARYISVLKTL